MSLEGERAYGIPFVEYYLKQFAKQGDRIIDIGCGRGQYRHSTRARYVGLDVTDEPYAPDSPRHVDIVAVGTDIPVRSGSFDLVFAVGVVYQIDDPYRALKEFHRILRSGGHILLVDYNRRTQGRLEVGEACKRPCWTQWGLRAMVQGAGFRDCTLQLPVCHEVGRPLKPLGVVWQEFMGTWAIVTGVK